MQETYIDIMIQSLNKKLQVLDAIIEQNIKQKEVLENQKSTIEEFDATVEAKTALIEQMQQLDSGFEKLFDRVKEELAENKGTHAESIKIMQSCIRGITDKSMEIQAQEARNRDLMVRKFAFVRETAKNVRTNSKVASQYYKNMMKLNYVDSQFMDNKK